MILMPLLLDLLKNRYNRRFVSPCAAQRRDDLALFAHLQSRFDLNDKVPSGILTFLGSRIIPFSILLITVNTIIYSFHNMYHIPVPE